MIRIGEGFEPKEVGVVVREELERSSYINNVDVSIEDDVISIIFSSINEINFQEFGLRLKKALEENGHSEYIVDIQTSVENMN